MKKMTMMMIFKSCVVVIANKCSISCYTCTTAAAAVCTSVFMLFNSSKCFSIHVLIVEIVNLCPFNHLLIIN